MPQVQRPRSWKFARNHPRYIKDYSGYAVKDYR